MVRWLILALAVLLSAPLVADTRWQRVDALADLLGDARPTPGGIAIDMPLVSDNGGEIPLALAFTAALAENERITELRVFAPRNPRPEVIEFHFHSERALPRVSTRIRLSETQTVYALASSNRGNHWLAQHDIRVATSGCLMDDDRATEMAMSNPRLAGPRNPRTGEPGEYRALVNHPMETGIRTDGSEAPPQALVEYFGVYEDNSALFSSRFHTGTSANPYVSFTLRQTEAPLRFVWRDQQSKELEKHLQ